MERSSVYPLSSIPVAPEPGRNEAISSGVSWGAVFSGAFVAAALSLILLALGAGAGMSSVAPWSNGSPTARVGFVAIVWLVATQLIASAMGGYLAGRLRTKWVNIHTDEVHFRDTAHGFLVWAVGLVLTVAFLASAAATMVGGTPAAGARGILSGISSDERPLSSDQYFVDKLFRSDRLVTADTTAMRSEARTIFANAAHEGNLIEPDKAYVAGLVVATAGLSQSDAEKRVSDVFLQMQQAADAARKAVAHSLYWTFLALLIGAFSASVAATIGGKQRDHIVVV